MRQVRFRDPAGMVRTGEWHGDAVSFADETYDLDEVDVLPPCEPSKIVCIGLNYADHAEETGMEVPERPMLFLKPPNTVAAHGDTVPLPAGKERVDWEAEIAVVVGHGLLSASERFQRSDPRLASGRDRPRTRATRAVSPGPGVSPGWVDAPTHGHPQSPVGWATNVVSIPHSSIRSPSCWTPNVSVA